MLGVIARNLEYVAAERYCDAAAQAALVVGHLPSRNGALAPHVGHVDHVAVLSHLEPCTLVW